MISRGQACDLSVICLGQATLYGQGESCVPDCIPVQRGAEEVVVGYLHSVVGLDTLPPLGTWDPFRARVPIERRSGLTTSHGEMGG